MHVEGFDCKWGRPATGGFEWIQHGGKLVLRGKPDITFAKYDPLAVTPPIYRLFAETEPTPEGTLVFANRCGRLGTLFSNQEEEFNVWRNAIVWMREAIRLWGFAVDGDTTELARCIRWKGTRACYDPPRSVWADEGRPWGKAPMKYRRRYVGYDILAESGLAADVVERGDVLRPAWLLIWLLVNGRIALEVGTMGHFDLATGQNKLGHFPRRLLAAIWLKLALAIIGEKHGRQCAACGNWFEVSPADNRADRQTCSGSCRTKLYRHRQENARRMHAEGKSVRQIVSELNVNREILKGWLSSTKG
jgi:hypothetical protein